MYLSLQAINSLKGRYKDFFYQYRLCKGVIYIHLVALYIPNGYDSEKEAERVELNGRCERLLEIDTLDLREPSYNQPRFKFIKQAI